MRTWVKKKLPTAVGSYDEMGDDGVEGGTVGVLITTIMLITVVDVLPLGVVKLLLPLGLEQRVLPDVVGEVEE
jgi:hypothetical protein